MSAPVKFLFDNDFISVDDQPAGGVVAGRDRKNYASEAEARGYTQGYAAAKLEATEAERQLASALSRSAAGIEAVASRLSSVESRLEAEAVEIAFTIARKLAPALIAQQPWIEVAELVRNCMQHLAGVPHIVVRVSDAVYEAAQTRLEELARNCGFAGRLAVIADPDLAAGDARVEWADGGTKRDIATTEATVAEAVNRYVALRRKQDAAQILENTAS